jgi:asparagine synthase (glutamine-hydrolysing)
MCGIAGLVTSSGLSPSDRELVDAMLRSIAHRGPDDHWSLADDRAIVGVRRLSIIDLDTGRQPVANEDGSIWVTQNGEIYNYVELRKELENLGHVFSTRSDTETIVHLYEQYGDGFVDHLRGMFAIALWDRRVHRLVLARDRLGKKPLYWRLADGRLTYGSELKAILADASATRRIDRTALAQFLEYQYIPSPRTIIEGIQKLPPATLLTWDGGEVTTHRYWEPRYEPKPHLSAAEEREECLALLREATRLRLRSDVPVGLFLSGGIDSGTVGALMAEASARPIRTFTVGFDDPDINELSLARITARHIGSEHTEEVVHLDAFEMLPAFVEHFDEPFGDPSALPTFRLAQLAARDVKVVLSGDGGDEVFGGYDRYRRQLALSRMDMIPAAARGVGASAAQRIVRRLPASIARARRGHSWPRLARMTYAERYLDTMSIFDSAWRARLLRDSSLADQDAYLDRVFKTGPRDQIDRMMRTDVLTYLPEDVLVKVDRATMASSLEARAPLLDHVLVDFAAKLPASRKLRFKTAKLLFRDIARELLPEALLDQPKFGFTVPLGEWFRAGLGDRFREVVLAPDAQLRDHLDQSVAGQLLDDHEHGRGDHAHQLWALLVFELWARRWLTNAPAGVSPEARSIEAIAPAAEVF